MNAEEMNDTPGAESVQQALRDIAVIRRCIEHNETGVTVISGRRSRQLTNFLHLGLLAVSGLVLLMELLSNGLNTKLLMLSRTNAQLQYIGLMNLGLFLIVLSYVFYFTVSHAARDKSLGNTQFITRHFAYLTNLSLFTDLFIKFVVFSLIVYAGKPEWIASLLLLFIGDYLVQGRLFVFPFGLGLLLGLITTVAAGLCFFYGVFDLSVPLIAFVLVTILSWLYFLSRDKGERE